MNKNYSENKVSLHCNHKCNQTATIVVCVYNKYYTFTEIYNKNVQRLLIRGLGVRGCPETQAIDRVVNND